MSGQARPLKELQFPLVVGEHEAPGMYATGTIVRTYASG